MALDADMYTNIIVPKEMVPYVSDKTIGIQYYWLENDEWESGLVFIKKKFVKRTGNYSFKVGLVKNWTYWAFTKEGKRHKLHASTFIFYLINEREKKYGSR